MSLSVALIALLTLSSLGNNTVKPEETWQLGTYTIQTFREPTGDRRLAFFKDGKEMYSRSVGQFWFVNAQGTKPMVSGHDPAASDVTGDGIPDVVIEQFPNHAQCCWSYSIISLGPTTVKEAATADGFPSPMTLEDLNGDRIVEIVGDDWAFDSWFASPRVVLRYNKRRGQFEIASNLMRRQAPTAAQLSAKAAAFRTATVYAGQPVAPEVYRYMLDLVYSGNPDSAWAFLDLAWPKDKAGKQEFVESFKEQLSKSRFWPEIAAMSKIQIPTSE